MWDVSLCCGKHSDPKHQELTRGPSWDVMVERKKRIKEGSEQQGNTETQLSTAKNKHKVLSAELSLFMSDKYPFCKSFPICSYWEKK